MFEASGDNDSAIADMRKVLEGDTLNAADWYRLSVLYRKAGRSEETSAALKHYRSLRDEGSNREVESFRKEFLETIADH